MGLTNFTDGQTAVVADWLNAVFGDNGHVHDGKNEDGHAPKVDLKDHVDYDGDGDGSAEGEMGVTTDTASEHEIEHQHTGSGHSLFGADRLKALGGILFGKFDSSFDFDFRSLDSPGTSGSGYLQAATLWLVDRLNTKVIRHNNSYIIDVQDYDGNSGAGGFWLDALRAANDVIDVRDSGGNSGEGGFILDILETDQDPIQVRNGPGQDADAGLSLDHLRAGFDSKFIDVENKAGASGEGGLILDALRPGTNDTVDVQDTAGNPFTGGVRLDRIQAGTSDEIDVENDGGVTGRGTFRSKTVPKALAFVDDAGGLKESHEVKGVEKVGTGHYQIEFNNPPDQLDDLIPIVSTAPKVAGGAATITVEPAMVDANNSGTTSEGLNIWVYGPGGNKVDPNYFYVSAYWWV